jgi:hypothetical protein
MPTPPRRNRVTPRSELIAVPARGTLLGNRGILHDAQGRIGRRRWTTLAWVTCRLEFKGRRRALLQPGHYTELFFLDEATALAAGHRPCGECRREDFARFKGLWLEAMGLPPRTRIKALDRVLHAERTRRDAAGATHRAELAALPDGTLVRLPGSEADWLVLGTALLRWTPQGYTERRPRALAGTDGKCRSGDSVAVLTPPLTLRVLAAGYRPALHASTLQAAHPQAQPASGAAP